MIVSTSSFVGVLCAGTLCFSHPHRVPHGHAYEETMVWPRLCAHAQEAGQGMRRHPVRICAIPHCTIATWQSSVMTTSAAHPAGCPLANNCSIMHAAPRVSQPCAMTMVTQWTSCGCCIGRHACILRALRRRQRSVSRNCKLICAACGLPVNRRGGQHWRLRAPPCESTCMERCTRVSPPSAPVLHFPSWRRAGLRLPWLPMPWPVPTCPDLR